MTNSSLESLVKSISDGKEGIITLVNGDGEKLHLDCIYKESIAPNFFVVLASAKLPDDIDENAPFTFSVIDEAKETSIIHARFAEKVNKKTLELTAAKTIDPSSLREYFRVDLRTNITISYTAETVADSQQNWLIEGQTIDLSATGVLGIFPSEPLKIGNIKIEVDLYHPKRRVQCIGHVVRTRRTRSGKWHAALHFDQISAEIRDEIITNCLWEQRRQLRENIQTSD